jgi:hypothetical protein
VESPPYDGVSGQCPESQSVSKPPQSADVAQIEPARVSKAGGRRAGAGRPREHGLPQLRKTLRTLTTNRLDGRTSLAVAVKAWKSDVRNDLGGDLSRAEETLLELAAQTWVQVSSLDAWLAVQPSLILARKRTVIPVMLQRMQLADSLARHLERLGLKREGEAHPRHPHPGRARPVIPNQLPSRISLPGADGNGGNRDDHRSPCCV